MYVLDIGVTVSQHHLQSNGDRRHWVSIHICRDNDKCYIELQ